MLFRMVVNKAHGHHQVTQHSPAKDSANAPNFSTTAGIAIPMPITARHSIAQTTGNQCGLGNIKVWFMQTSSVVTVVWIGY